MKQSLILAIIGMAMSMSVHAQVQFSRFKFYVADIMNCICLTNMKFNAILPLKWQNTADIVAILVGLKQETVSLMCRKCAGSVAR